ncbi:MAG: hypothetical protein ACKVQV_11085 [Bacteroidia bacterium]
MKKTILVAVIATSTMFTSCKKDKVKGCMDPISISYNADAEEDDGSCHYAGTGGNTTIIAFPKHHSKLTRPYHAYVKFNSQDFPGANPSAYDLDLIADTTQNSIEIANLKPGKYYIYMTAYDTTVSAPVKGGIPYVLSQSSGQLVLTVPVTE